MTPLKRMKFDRISSSPYSKFEIASRFSDRVGVGSATAPVEVAAPFEKIQLVVLIDADASKLSMNGGVIGAGSAGSHATALRNDVICACSVAENFRLVPVVP